MWPGNSWIQLQAGYSYSLTENTSDGQFQKRILQTGFLWPFLPFSSFLKEGIDRGKIGDKETPFSASDFLFPCWRPHLFFTLLSHPHVLQLAWKWLHQVLERRSREMSMGQVVPKCPGGCPLQFWDAASETQLCFFGCFQKKPLLPRYNTRRIANYTSLQENPKIAGNYDAKDVLQNTFCV